MILTAAALLTLGAILFTLFVRARDLPAPEPVSPVQHLDERKAAIYENLRDLQFEFRVGKLSEDDYQKTKLELQKELAAVMAEIEKALGQPSRQVAPARRVQPPTSPPAPSGTLCPHCGARFPQTLKFCGECGKPVGGTA